MKNLLKFRMILILGALVFVVIYHLAFGDWNF